MADKRMLAASAGPPTGQGPLKESGGSAAAGRSGRLVPSASSGAAPERRSRPVTRQDC
uniref:Uncharacterized protein n=1 Tax=Streptomyces sp. NBC_00003 TaxID=2903608 RepID=A0AAU2UWC0_9ACTN